MRSFLSIFLIALLSVMAACKPHFSLNGATIPIEAKTISVAQFTNNTTLAGPTAAQGFTEKLRDMVSSQTNLGLVKQGGDLQFEGYISSYNVAPVSIQSNDQAAQNRLTMSVTVKYTNRFEEAKNFEQEFTRFADFQASLPLSSVEATLLPEINRQLTEDIFNKAFNNW